MAASSANPSSAPTQWQERWKNPRFRWSIILAAAILFLLGLFFYPEQPAFRVRSLVAHATPSKDRPVEVEARLDKNLFEHRGEQATLRVIVTNRTPATQPAAETQPPSQLTGLEVFLEAPGFDVSGVEQSAANHQKFFVCAPGDAQSTGALPAGGSCTTQLTLSARDLSGTSAVTVFVDWNEGAPQEAGLSLGPVKFDSIVGPARWNRLGRRVAQALRDLMIPIMLALVGIWFNRRQEAREEKRRRIEKRREEDRRKAERKEADRQQVRILLLKTVMRLAKKYYLPIVAEAKAVVLEGKKERPERSTDLLFFHLLVLLKRIDDLKMKEGAVFFQKRFGEAAIGYAWTILRAASYGVLGEELLSSTLTEVVKADWEYARFTGAKRKLVKLRQRFEQWQQPQQINDPKDPCRLYGEFGLYLGVLDTLQAVFRFEADRALSEGWYEEASKVDFKLDAPTKIPAFRGDALAQLRDISEKLSQTLETNYSRKAELV